MYTMKQVGEETGLAYETLKFYCNQGLIPYGTHCQGRLPRRCGGAFLTPEPYFTLLTLSP